MEGSPAASLTLGAAASPSVETPVASTASPAAAKPVIANAPEAESSPVGEEAAPSNRAATAVASVSPATDLAPAKIREWLQPWVWLLVAGVLILAWVAIPMIRRAIARPSTRSVALGLKRSAF